MTNRGKGAHKNADITATPIKAEVTPNRKQGRERKQEAPKKLQGIVKKGLDDYFGKGKRIPAPSMKGDPVTMVMQRRNACSAKSLRTESANNNEGQNKKPKSDNEDLAEEENQEGKKGLEEEEGWGGFVVDLESMSILMKKKSTKAKSNKKVAKDKQEEKKKKATFRQDEPQETGGKKDEEEVAVYFTCIVGFAIRVDKGNNAKGGFDKKILEGLAFLCKYLDKALCILPSGKDPRLNPIKLKTDLPKYQVIMKNYFSIPNPMAFSNVTQDGSRVIKGSAVMGFLIDPKECLEEVAGDLWMMGCSLFYKKCQEVDTVSKLILLGVPNTIEAEEIQKNAEQGISGPRMHAAENRQRV
jgi:hypothetical protein